MERSIKQINQSDLFSAYTCKADTGPWALYIYDADGYHNGKQWFANPIKYPREQITIEQAYDLSTKAFAAGKEIRVTDGGDMLVFHCLNKVVLYGENFWSNILTK